MTTNTENTSLKSLVMDEYNYHIAGGNENLKEELRAIEGIPDATYLVKDGKVFVFDKLVQLVKNSLKENSSLKAEDLAIQCFEDAHVTPLEAVKEWNIVPEPYESLEVKKDTFKIRHRIFKSTLPATYSSKSELNNAYADILLGKIVAGAGDFNYRGQSMILSGSFAVSSLPPMPIVNLDGITGKSIDYNFLENSEYVEGFTPITKENFEELKHIESKWNEINSIVQQYVTSNLPEVWKLSENIGLESLNNTVDKPEVVDEEISKKLRELYPELKMLDSATLFEIYENFELDENMGNWEGDTYRYESFILYVLSKLTGTFPELGHWVGYSLLQGHSSEEAIELSNTTIKYTMSLKDLALKTSNVMQYLADNKDITEQRGIKIITLGDIYRQSRKFGSGIVLGTQVP